MVNWFKKNKKDIFGMSWAYLGAFFGIYFFSESDKIFNIFNDVLFWSGLTLFSSALIIVSLDEFDLIKWKT